VLAGFDTFCETVHTAAISKILRLATKFRSVHGGK
jgi:hypothetical protein